MKKKCSYLILALFTAFCLMMPLDVSAAKKITPQTVKLMKISSSDYNKVTINWKKVSGATHYKIYYRKSGTKKWNGVKTVSSKHSSYTHTSNKSDPIIIGQKYDYTVRGYNSKYKTNGKYNTKGLTVRTLPEAPRLFKPEFNKDSNSVSLKWEKGKGCDSYYIYRKSSEKGKWNKVDVVNGDVSSYKDIYPIEDAKNSYTVRGYNKKYKVYSKSEAFVESVIVPDFGIVEDGWEEFPPEYSWPVERLAKEVVRLTNIEREKAGVQPLIYHPSLEKGAMVRAKEISYHFSHTRPNGQTSGTAAEAFDVGDVGGENIAMGQKTPERVVEAWMDSPGHRHTMMLAHYKYLGVGCYRDETGMLHWVQTFAGEKANDKVTFTLNLNGGECENDSILAPYRKRMTQKDFPIPKKEGYVFKGWAIYNDSYPFESCATSSVLPLTALWEKV